MFFNHSYFIYIWGNKRTVFKKEDEQLFRMLISKINIVDALKIEMVFKIGVVIEVESDSNKNDKEALIRHYI